jgi:adenylate cyclase class 2
MPTQTRQIEIKVLEANVDDLIKRLTVMGAVIEFDGELTNVYFDNDAHQYTDGKDTLRLRKARNVTTLAYKKHISSEEAKVKDVWEVEVGDLEQMGEILENLGFHVLHESMKRRTGFNLGEVYFNIDSYPNIPSYLEVMAPDVETINANLQKLGIDPAKAVPWSIKEVFEHYGVNQVI